MAPPLIAVVPPALVVSEAALTELEKVVVPVEFTVKAPRAWLAPTAPEKVTLPEPAVTVRARVFDGLLLTVDVNATEVLLVVAVTVDVKTTGPVYVCAPDVLTLPPILMAEDEVRLSVVNALVAPTVEPKVIEPEPVLMVKLVPVGLALTITMPVARDGGVGVTPKFRLPPPPPRAVHSSALPSPMRWLSPQRGRHCRSSR